MNASSQKELITLVTNTDTVITLARNLVGKSKWKQRAPIEDFPNHLDCSGLTMWVFAQIGIFLPRDPAGQFEYCRQHGRMIEVDDLSVGDLLFVDSPCSKKREVIGHVCLMVASDTLVCATRSELGRGIIEIPLYQVLKTRRLCGIGRLIFHPK
ncbi:MAG: NlpC/P60 family protein [Patescibacteria group bacterium]|jgi:cell wall-associated NlpC family hydrolase